MSDSVSVEGKEYISSKRASELSGYSQDYIGQLSRGKHIDAQRVGGLWYVSMESLQNYKVTAEAYRPEPPIRKQISDPDSLISFDGKDYISAARAAKITSYHQDYVGQLARSGTLLARQVGNRWYVERDGLLAHKKEKDALLAAVQSESVGLRRPETLKSSLEAKENDYAAEDGYFTYTNDGGDLMPIFGGTSGDTERTEDVEEKVTESAPVPVPIRIVERKQILHHTGHAKPVKSKRRIHGKTIFYGSGGVMAFTIVIVLTFGFSTVGKTSMYAAATKSTGYGSSALQFLKTIGDVLEDLIVPELSYRRAK